ncbi:hypothetical protein WI942_002492 [Klebsiella aerogenes]|uniref:hypothetical protein n=1 Tax=Klebsiella aerogenes TaxID=548 RepID=UPI0027F36188|nr:hypothetical protein [Klebsiella aerogenes]
MKHESGLTLNQLAERNANLVTELEKCRELSGCPAGVDLQDWVKQLAAESLTMIRLLTDISENHVEYLSEGEGYMFAGVPLDYVSEINMYVSRDVNAENPFPATDRIVAEAEARGVEKFAKKLESRGRHQDYVEIANAFAQQMREGAK